MNRYITADVGGFNNKSAGSLINAFHPILKNHLITYVSKIISKIDTINRRPLSLSLFALFISVSMISCGPGNNSDLGGRTCNETNSDIIPSPDTSVQLADSGDCFGFTLPIAGTFTISTSGFADTVGRLYDSSGSLIEENNDDGFGANFEISSFLSAGTYYLLVRPFDPEDAFAPYTFNIDYDPTPTSCTVDSTTSIISIPYTSSGFSLSSPQDIDCFTFTLSAGRTVTISTTGSIDTYGGLYDSNENLIALNDDTTNDDGEITDLNFSINRFLSSGTYYVEVIVAPLSQDDFSSGSYTLNVR